MKNTGKWRAFSLFVGAVACSQPVMANAESTSLSNMVVTATRTDIPAELAPSGYSQVNRDQIERKMAFTLSDMIQDLPGVALDYELDGRNQIRIRGFQPSQTLILINGRRINNTDVLTGHTDFRMTQIPTAAIERVEVVKGPISSLYGADALGGVVNAIVRPPSDSWTGRVQARTGVVDNKENSREHGISLYTAGPVTDQFGVLFSLDAVDTDGVLNPDLNGIDELESRKAVNVYSSLFFNPTDRHEFEVFYMASDDDRLARRGSALDRENEVFRYSTGVRHDYSADTWQTRIDIYRSRSKQDSLHLSGSDQSTDDIIDVSGSWDWQSNQTLTLGADIRRENFQRERSGVIEHDNTVYHKGLLAQNRSGFWDDRLIVTLGTRFDDHTHYSGEISPRAGLVFSLTESTRFKADYGRGFSAPDLRRADGGYDFTFSTSPLRILGNADLEPERSNSYSFSLEHETTERRASVTLFRNDITDLIDLLCIENCPPGGPLPGQNEVRIYNNVDSARTQGIELEYSQWLGRFARINSNYTYLDAKNRDTDERLERRPQHRLNVALELYPWDGGELNLRTEYTGRMLRGDAWAKDFTLFHLGLRQALTEKLYLQAGVDNVTDERLADIDPKYTNEIRGRFYYLAAGWEF